jgi:hypothetical protein
VPWNTREGGDERHIPSLPCRDRLAPAARPPSPPPPSPPPPQEVLTDVVNMGASLDERNTKDLMVHARTHTSAHTLARAHTRAHTPLI